MLLLRIWFSKENYAKIDENVSISDLKKLTKIYQNIFGKLFLSENCNNTTDSYLSHETGQGHPERADRVSVVIENFKKNKKLAWKKPGKFDSKYLKITHNSII